MEATVDTNAHTVAFREGLREQGLVEGRDLRLVFRFAGPHRAATGARG
jgi:hypothetical protein